MTWRRSAGHAPTGAWQYGRERMQSEFMDAHAWLERGDGSIYDNIGCFAPHTLEEERYVRKAWEKHDPEYDRLLAGMQSQIDKVAREMRGDDLCMEDVLREAQAELEVRVLTCFRVALLERMRLGAGRVRLGSFGVTFEAGDKKVMWVHGNGARESAPFAPGTALRCLQTGGGVYGPNGKLYEYTPQ